MDEFENFNFCKFKKKNQFALIAMVRYPMYCPNFWKFQKHKFTLISEMVIRRERKGQHLRAHALWIRFKFYKWIFFIQVSQRHIINSVNRETSGDYEKGLLAVGKHIVNMIEPKKLLININVVIFHYFLVICHIIDILLNFYY